MSALRKIHVGGVGGQNIQSSCRDSYPVFSSQDSDVFFPLCV